MQSARNPISWMGQIGAQVQIQNAKINIVKQNYNKKVSNKYVIIAWAWTRSKTGNSNLNIFVRDGIEEADFAAVFFISQLWDLSSNTDSYKYRSMEIDVSWVEQSTEIEENFLENFERDSKRPLWTIWTSHFFCIHLDLLYLLPFTPSRCFLELLHQQWSNIQTVGND